MHDLATATGNDDIAAVFFGGGNLTASSVGDGITTIEPSPLAGLFEPTSAAALAEPSFLTDLMALF